MDSKNLQESSKKKYKSWKKHLCGFQASISTKALGEFKPSDVTVELLDKAFSSYKCCHYGKSPGNFRDLLSEFWTWMTRRRYVSENIVPLISKGSRRSTKTTLNANHNDIGTLFRSVKDVRLRAVIILGPHNLRIGEILGLTEDRISGRTIKIRRQLKAVTSPEFNGSKTVHGLAKLKSSSASRDLTLNDKEMVIIQQSLSLARVHNIYDAVAKKVLPKTFVVPNKSGNRWCYNDFRRIWARAVYSAGLELTAHDLRRLFTSSSFTSDNETPLNPSAISRVLGHTDLDTTMIYNYVDDSQLQAVHHSASKRIEPFLILD